MELYSTGISSIGNAGSVTEMVLSEVLLSFELCPARYYPTLHLDLIALQSVTVINWTPP